MSLPSRKTYIKYILNIEIKAEDMARKGQININKSELMFVHKIKFDSVHIEKLNEITKSNLFKSFLGALRNTKRPTKRATIVAGIWE